ncbi:MAG: carboxypeptidase-like regulatory domain-containing protein [Janthinobacterium lividum]
MRQAVIYLPTPCAESWDAMTPTGAGRHCAACQKTVVDFSQQTDAELLAYFGQAGRGETCGRFGADQLDRPLRPAAALPPARRWLAWVAALAVWGLRETSSLPALAQRAATHHQPARPGPRPRPATGGTHWLKGVVCDSISGQPLAGVAVFLQDENRHAFTDSVGRFSLSIPRGPHPVQRHTLVLHRAGYTSRTVRLPVGTRLATRLRLGLLAEAEAIVEVVGYATQRRAIIMGGIPSVSVATLQRSAPAHSRSFWQWLTQPFRRSGT